MKMKTKISSYSTKTTGFCGKNVQRVKRETERKIIAVSSFNYLGYLI
jgi:hypothetical protein